MEQGKSRLQVGECYIDEKGRYWLITADYWNGKYQAEQVCLSSDWESHSPQYEVFLWSGDVAHPELSDVIDGPAPLIAHTENYKKMLDDWTIRCLPVAYADRTDDEGMSEHVTRAKHYAMSLLLNREF